MDVTMPLETAGPSPGAATMPVVRSLLREAPAIPPALAGTEVARVFEDDRTASAVVVVRDGLPIGLIDRLSFMSRFGTRYGRELYGKRHASHLMDGEPLIVGADLTIDEVGRRLFTLKPKALQTGFVMVEGGLYTGIVTGVDLLHALAQSLVTANERLREAQATLVQSEKMAALGALVAGVAHEINTPIGSALTAATAFADRARQFQAIAGGGSIRRQDIDRFVDSALQVSGFMQVNIRRASELISSFKQIAVDQTSDQRRRFRMAQCLDDVFHSLQPRMRKASVAYHLDCPEELELDSYPGAIAQVLTNLVMNALVHAFAKSDGRIAVTVAPVAGGAPDAAALELIVADDGCGIPAEIRPRVFDPFFTTRRGLGGSGLGLHIVYNLVTQRLGGTIQVEERAGGGALFRMGMPLTAP